MISDPEPTEVMPDQQAADRADEHGRQHAYVRLVLADHVAAGDVAQLEVHPQRVGRGREEQRAADHRGEEVLLRLVGHRRS